MQRQPARESYVPSKTPPRFGRFQCHLSTAIVLMFVAGGILWMNMLERRMKPKGGLATKPLSSPRNYFLARTEEEFLQGTVGFGWFGDRESYYGWPCDAAHLSVQLWVDKSGRTSGGTNRPTEWRVQGIVIDALTAIGILLSVAIVSEWWICRANKARKGA